MFTLFLLLPLLGQVQGDFQSFKGLSIPPDYWQPLSPGDPSDSGSLSSEETCPDACIRRGQECHGFEVSPDGSCTLGAVVPTWANGYVPEYVQDGRKVFLRSELVRRKAATGVTNLVGLRNNDPRWLSSAFENATLPAVSVPTAVPTGATPEVLVTTHGRGIVSCGAVESSSYTGKCWQWSFMTGTWRQLPGEMTHCHYFGRGVHLSKKLWVFGGMTEYESWVGTRKAEVYDFKTGQWEDLPEMPDGYNVDSCQVVAISDTEILLVQGRWPGNSYTKKSYVYDTVQRTYTYAGDIDTVDYRGIVNAGCTADEDRQFVVCAGGYNDWVGLTPRVLIFDIPSKTWQLYDSSNDLPYASSGAMHTLGDRIFHISSETEEVLEFKPGETPLWVTVAGASIQGASTVFFKMDYTELLV